MSIPLSPTQCTDAADWSAASLLPLSIELGGAVWAPAAPAVMPDFAVLLTCAPIMEATVEILSDAPVEPAAHSDAAGRLIASTAPGPEPLAGGLACGDFTAFTDAGALQRAGSPCLSIAAPALPFDHRPTLLSAHPEQAVHPERDDAPSDGEVETASVEWCGLTERITGFVRADKPLPQSPDDAASGDDPVEAESINLAAHFALPLVAAFDLIDTIALSTPGSADTTASSVIVEAASPDLRPTQQGLDAPRNRRGSPAPRSAASSTGFAPPHQPSTATDPSLAPVRLDDEVADRTTTPASILTADVAQETDRRPPESLASHNRPPVAVETVAPAPIQAMTSPSDEMSPHSRVNHVVAAPHSVLNVPPSRKPHDLLPPQSAEVTTAPRIETLPTAPQPAVEHPAAESTPANLTMREMLTDVSGASLATPERTHSGEPRRSVAAPSLSGGRAASVPIVEDPIAGPEFTANRNTSPPLQGHPPPEQQRPAAADQPLPVLPHEHLPAAIPASREEHPESERSVNVERSPQAGAPAPTRTLPAATATASPGAPMIDAPPMERPPAREVSPPSGSLPDWRAPEAQLIHAAIARMQIVRRLGESEFDLRLTPPELGTLRVSLRQTREGLNVQVAADDPATQSLLESSRHEIAQALQRDQPGGVRLSLQTHTEGDRSPPPPEPPLWEDRPGVAQRAGRSTPHVKSNSQLSFLA